MALRLVATWRLGSSRRVGKSASRPVAGSEDAKRRMPREASKPCLQAGDFRGVHLREAEALLAEVLERSADQVEFAVVDDEEPVVEVLAEADGQRRILGVELGDVGREDLRAGIALAVAVLRGDDRDRDALLLRGEHVQRLHRRPVVDEEQRLPRALHQPVDERPRVPELAVVEDALKGRRLRLDEEIDLLLQFGDVLVVGDKTAVHGIEPSRLNRSKEHSLLDHLGGPLAKTNANDRIHAIADGNDGVEIVVGKPARDVPRSFPANLQGFLGS